MESTVVYATITPVNFEMDIPSRVSVNDAELDFDRLYLDAVNYGNNGGKGVSLRPGEKGPSIKTTVSTQRFAVNRLNLVGFKSKVAVLPDVFEKAASRADLARSGADTSRVVEAEKAISQFKQFAARRLERALADGVEGYDNCVAVINEINTKAVRGLVKLEFYLKRVSATEFPGAGQSKRDQFWYRTDKIRKFYTTGQPSVGLVEAIIRDSLLSTEVVVLNNDFKFVRRDRKNRSSDGRFEWIHTPSVAMVRVKFEPTTVDGQVSSMLREMRKPKGERLPVRVDMGVNHELKVHEPHVDIHSHDDYEDDSFSLSDHFQDSE